MQVYNPAVSRCYSLHGCGPVLSKCTLFIYVEPFLMHSLQSRPFTDKHSTQRSDSVIPTANRCWFLMQEMCLTLSPLLVDYVNVRFSHTLICGCAYPQTWAPTSSRPPKSNKAGFCQSGLLFLFHHYPNRHISHGVLQSTCKKKKKRVFDLSLAFLSRAAVDAAEEGVIPAASYSAQRKVNYMEAFWAGRRTLGLFHCAHS